MLALADFAVVVSDAQKTSEWWEKNLGFRTFTVGGGGHAKLVAPPGERFVLHLCEGFGPLEPGNTGIAFVTDEIEALTERMTAAGVEFPEPLKTEEWGAMAKFADPDGNVFWLLGVPTKIVRDTLASRAPAARTTPRRTPRSGASRARHGGRRPTGKRPRTARASRSGNARRRTRR